MLTFDNKFSVQTNEDAKDFLQEDKKNNRNEIVTSNDFGSRKQSAVLFLVLT